MVDYILSKTTLNESPEDIWTTLLSTLNIGDHFFSVGNSPKRYTITNMSINTISYKGNDRSGGIPEDITKDSFIALVDGLKGMHTFNTDTSKELFKGAKIYKKRSPMFALLLGNKIIERERK